MNHCDLDHIKKLLDEKYTCYVLVTCDNPSASGKMQVEMSYEGDPALAAYLLQGAQSYIEEQDEIEKIN